MCATPCHFVPSSEEVAHTFIDVSVNAAECRSARPMAEVVRPAKQRPVQRVAHFGPRIVVAGHQQIANLRLEPLHALLGRARAQIPMTVCFVTVRPERVAEEVETFSPSILQRGFGLVERQLSASARVRPGHPMSSGARSRSPRPRAASSCSTPRRCTAILSTATRSGLSSPIWKD